MNCPIFFTYFDSHFEMKVDMYGIRTIYFQHLLEITSKWLLKDNLYIDKALKVTLIHRNRLRLMYILNGNIPAPSIAFLILSQIFQIFKLK